MYDCIFFYDGSQRRIYLEKLVDYDDAELTAAKFAQNNLNNYSVTSKSEGFLRIEGATNDAPLIGVTILILKHRE